MFSKIKIKYSKIIPIKIEAKTIFKNFKKNILLNVNNFFFLKKINNKIELNHDDIDVAIGIIIKPILLKKYTLIITFKITEIREI